ncbi:hypothetical protein Q3C01_11130 [Bradyrhizobium sp. UFLA05-109]
MRKQQPKARWRFILISSRFTTPRVSAERRRAETVDDEADSAKFAVTPLLLRVIER